MTKLYALLFFMVSSLTAVAGALSGEQVIAMMHAKYYGQWHKTRTFQQRTQMYQDDSLIRDEYWYEAIQFPAMLRIDVGDTVNGNSILFRNDSLFKYMEKRIVYLRPDVSNLMFMMGGMYSLPLERVKGKLKGYGYDLNKAFETTWKGTPVYVIGAGREGERSNQLWIDKTKLVILRMIEIEHGEQTEMDFEDHVLVDGAWMETKVTFLQAGKTLQVEQYSNYRVNIPIDPLVFDPDKLHTIYWYK